MCARPVRVALIDMPLLLNELVEAALAHRSEVTVVANVRQCRALEPAVGVEFVVAGSAGVETVGIAQLLAKHPLVRILVIRDEGRAAVLFGPEAIEPLASAEPGMLIGELSLERLLRAIRASRRPGTP